MQFEYKVKQLPLDYERLTNEAVTDVLNGEGNKGWELVSVTPDPNRKGFGLFYLKKSIK